MNYRHGFHAGNFADVIKHIVLALIIEYLKKKSKPFRYIDTHAGCGLYDLHGDQATRTQEWENGIGKLVTAKQLDTEDAQFDVVRSYLSIIADLNSGNDLQFYPGSPLIARALLREHDRLIVNELHAEDCQLLRSNFGRSKTSKVMNLDAWNFLRSTLPPPERRGVILIDPPFEQPGEFDRIVPGLTAAARRFATGIYLLWYPIKHPREVARFKQSLVESGLKRLMAVEVFVTPFAEGAALTGTGLLVHNPPFG
ncbi:MAG: 23S rRNA (adenine(2030)-N(6))-methyltransferase RlmJ, partial [Pseudomonadota bacterium]